MNLKGNVNIDTSRIRNAFVNFLVPIVCLTISAILFFLIIYPSVSRVPQLQSDLESKRALRDTLAAKKENIYKLVDFKSVVDENSLLVDRALPSEEFVPALLDQVDTIARNSGLDVTKLSYTFGEVPSEEEQSGSYNIVVISLGAEGTYEQMVTFMKSAETAARLINVANFRFAEIGDNNTLSLNFSVYSPYLMVQSSAITDDPVTLDIASDNFISFINRVKNLRYYDYSNIEDVNVDDLPIVPFEPEVEESTPSEEGEEVVSVFGDESGEEVPVEEPANLE
ncbi:hypothetical protein C4561_02470 [candidate division WWE3 bacterium]|jgi:Tfp pilus assembly protein PilO|uniref:Uncharacterized protein n=1 Tax=candidate division WWE3 bacterium TaxID=2053526 RepID=A0A3A4ZE59_UNCKA|nr:MAG: hypothetical protein C4561_02470 [candidate division WWE3 bacterium]